MSVECLNLSISAQNCNSLNLSTLTDSHTAKIVSIEALNTDIIYLSDTRMNGKHGQVADAFRLKYKMYHNSFTGKRGVAILIRNGLHHEVLEEERDPAENLLFLRIRIRTVELVLGAVYGPNKDEFATFDFLHGICSRWSTIPFILGGDWNATYSVERVGSNPDVFFMQAIPSAARTARILQICEDWNLSDPFRGLHPDDKDYTYVPAGALRKNRSRIDFFFLSDSLFGHLLDCTISQ